MRVFTAIRHSINPAFYYGGLWSGNFYPALRELGCEVRESQVDLLPASRFMGIPQNFTGQEKQVRSEITQNIIDEIKKSHKEKKIDLFLSYFYNAHFDPAGFDEIHKLGIPTANFYCNSVYQFEFVKDIAKKVTFSWHTEKDAQESYLKIGANPVWVQMGANPKIYSPLNEKPRKPKACFVGQRYADRESHLAQLIKDNVPVDVYGVGWNTFVKKIPATERLRDAGDLYLGRRHPKEGSLYAYLSLLLANVQSEGLANGLKRTVKNLLRRNDKNRIDSLLKNSVCGFAEDVKKTFADYEVILNFSNVWKDGHPGSALIPHVRLRDFEAPMCRTCYITGYSDEIAEFYDLGREIDAYQTSEELAEKVKFYLSHPVEAERLREAGYRRALRDHTWKRRFETLFKKIDLQK